MTSRLAYEMSTAIIAGAAAHRLRQLGAAEVKVTVTLTPDIPRMHVEPTFPTTTRRRRTD